VPDEAAGKTARGRSHEDGGREDDADHRACRDAGPGRMLRRLLVLAHVHVTMRVLGDDGGVVGPDHVVLVQGFDRLEVELRVGYGVVGGQEEKDGFVCHACSLVSGSPVWALNARGAGSGNRGHGATFYHVRPPAR
jgi:hypothetical protein